MFKGMKLILDTDTVKVCDGKEKGIILYCKLAGQQNAWVEHFPMSNDVKGILGSLAVASDYIAGKVFPFKVTTESEPKETPKQENVTGFKPKVV